MYDVNGLPSIVMSTRRALSLTVRRTPGSPSFLFLVRPEITPNGRTVDSSAASNGRAQNRIDISPPLYSLSPCDYILLLIVECDPFAGMQRRDRHTQRDRVTVGSMNIGVRRFARSHTLHPVAHVGGRGFVRARISASLGLLHFLQRHLGQHERFHTHFISVVLGQAAFRADLVLVKVERPAVGVVDLLDVTGAVGLAGRIHDLESLTAFGRISVIKHRSHGVEVLAAIAPQVDTAIGHDARRMVESAEPVHGIDLMDHPLIGYTGGVWPEQTELEMFSGIKCLERPID